MQQSFWSIITLSALIVLSSCSKEDASGKLIYQLRTKNPGATVNGTTSGSLNWTTGSAYVDKLKFEARKDGGSRMSYESGAGISINLFATAGNLGNIPVPPGSYSEIESAVRLNTSGSDTAFVLRGSFINNIGFAVPVLFFINTSVEFKAAASDIIIGSGASITALTTLDLSLLATGLTESMLSMATLTNGVLVISAGSNTNIYTIIMSNINNIDDVKLGV
jgi:hypothetical protein